MSWRPQSIGENLDDWLQFEVWQIVRSQRKASIHHIARSMIPDSNTLADVILRRDFPVWGCMTGCDRERLILGTVQELMTLHRLKPTGTEKFSRYTPLVEIEVLDALGSI